MTDPASVLAAIEADCRALDAVGKALGAKVKALTEAEIEYQDAYDAALLDSSETSKEKREAQARQMVPVELRGRVMRLRGDVESYKRYATIKAAALSGRQSQLATLKAEMAGAP
jgi:hypothetical protein